MKKVSVIVPIFNPGSYFDDCIKSILNQTYENIEIILVDNMSTDGTFEKCREYEDRNDNVRFVRCNERGVSNARNKGILMSTGYYIMFVDSDDVVCEKFCEKMVRTIESQDCDLGICGIKTMSEEGEKLTSWEFSSFDKSNVVDHGELLVNLYQNKLLNFVSNKIYIKEKIRYWFDTDLRVAEDLDFNMKYMQENKNVCYVNEQLYFYRIYVTMPIEKSEYYAEKRLENNIIVNERLLDFIKSCVVTDAVVNELMCGMANGLLFSFIEVAKSKKSKDELKKFFSDSVKNEAIQTFLNHVYFKTLTKRCIAWLINNKQINMLCCILKLYFYIKR